MKTQPTRHSKSSAKGEVYIQRDFKWPNVAYQAQKNKINPKPAEGER
jgi:hypothetical protein